jgi:hypothetical protein
MNREYRYFILLLALLIGGNAFSQQYHLAKEVNGITVTSGKHVYFSFDTISVKNITISDSANVELVAGKSVHFLPSSNVGSFYPSGKFHAYIDTTLLSFHIAVSNDTTVCAGTTPMLTATGGVKYHWSNGDTTSIISVNPIAKTVYYVTVTNAKGYYGVDSVTVNVNPLPFAFAGNDVIIPFGDSAVIGTPAISGYTYLWSPSIGLNNSMIAKPIAKPFETHEYKLKIINSNGCLITDKVIVQITNPLIIDIGPKEIRNNSLYSNTIFVKTINSQIISVTNYNEKIIGNNNISEQSVSLRSIFYNHALENDGNPDSIIFYRNNLDSLVPDERNRNIFGVVFPVMINVDSIMKELRSNPFIEQANPPYTLGLQQGGIPYYETDGFSPLWAIDKVQAPNAWVFLQNIQSASKQVVGIIDRGIAAHAEFNNPNRIVYSGYSCSPANDHSTEVGSIIASNPALTPIPSLGTISFGYNATLLSTHDAQFECNSPQYWYPFDEFIQTTSQNGSHPRFLNLSWVIFPPNGSNLSIGYESWCNASILLNNIKSLIDDENVMIFASSGNHQTNFGGQTVNIIHGIGYPFGIEGVIGVGSSSYIAAQNNYLFPYGESGMGGEQFSFEYNYNLIHPFLLTCTEDDNNQKLGFVDLVAPGKNIELAIPPDVNPPNLYDKNNGTSLSSPIVATIAASMAAVNTNNSILSNDVIKSILFNTADKINYYPFGIGYDPYNNSLFLPNNAGSVDDGYTYQNCGLNDINNDGFVDGFSYKDLDYIMGNGRVNMLSAIMNAAGLNPGGFTINNSLTHHKINISNTNDFYYQLYNHSLTYNSQGLNLKYDYDAILNQVAKDNQQNLIGSKITFDGNGSDIEIESNSTFRISGEIANEIGASMTFENEANLIFDKGTVTNNGQEFTKLVVEDFGTLNLKDRQFIIPNRCILEINANGTLNLDNGEIIIEPGGVLLLRSYGNINLSNESKISVLCGGYMSSLDNSNFYTDPSSYVHTYNDAIWCLNDIGSSCSSPDENATYINTFVGITSSLDFQNYFTHFGININTNLSLDPIFTFSSTDQRCMGNAIHFNLDNPINVCNYSWNFGDGCTISGIGGDIIPSGDCYNFDLNLTTTSGTYSNPNHIYIYPGYYSVSLTTSFQYQDDNGNTITCGEECYTKLIYIIPSTLSYNANCCSENQTYTTSLNNMSNDNEGNFNVISGVTSNIYNTGTYFIKGTITVEPNAILNIHDGTTIEFGPEGKIIVEPKGKLRISNSTLDGLSTCQTMWQGIEVWGNETSSNAADQGSVTISTGSIIKNAHIGILAGRNNINPANDCYAVKTNFSGGGIVTSNINENNYFMNNGIGIKMLPYKFNNFSTIQGCHFFGGFLKDPGYLSGNSYQYPYTNTFCPNYANANVYGCPVTGIYLWGVKTTILKYNEFAGDIAFTDMIEGIKSFDSRYDVSNSLFQNLDYGIRIFNTNSSIYGHTIKDNYTDAQNNYGFKNIKIDNIQIEGGKNDVIKNNYFNDVNFNFLTSSAGILLNNSSNFKINDNKFYYINLGINCINSGSGGCSISVGFDNPPYGNVFTECPLDIQTSSDNSKLQIHCNTSTNSDPLISSLSNWENYGPFTNQGHFDNTPDSKLPAGNAFFPDNVDAKKVINNYYYYKILPNLNVWAPIKYTYYRHGGINYSERFPSTASLHYIINSQSSPYNPSQSCYLCVNPPCYKSEMLNDNMKIGTFQTEYNTVLNSLDNGITKELLDSIADTRYTPGFKNLLLNSSPLSDTVLLALIDNYNKLPAIDFRDIIIPNSPVSDMVNYYLENIIDSLGIYADTIKKVQANIYPFRTLTAVSRELNGYINDYQLNLNNYIQDLIGGDSINNDSLDKAFTLLENQNSNNAKQMLFSTYLADSNFTAAEVIFNNFVPETQEETEWKILNSILIKFAIERKTVFEMDSIDEKTVRNIANDSLCSLATINAQAVLRLVYGEEFDPCPLPPNNYKINHKANNNNSESNFDNIVYLGNNIPNPFNNTTLIPYQLPSKWETAYLNIFDIAGKKLIGFQLTEDKSFINLSLDYYQQGVYLYNLNVDGCNIQTKRMVLIK